MTVSLSLTRCFVEIEANIENIIEEVNEVNKKSPTKKSNKKFQLYSPIKQSNKTVQQTVQQKKSIKKVIEDWHDGKNVI